jgi:hypothetical protein
MSTAIETFCRPNRTLAKRIDPQPSTKVLGYYQMDAAARRPCQNGRFGKRPSLFSPAEAAGQPHGTMACRLHCAEQKSQIPTAKSQGIFKSQIENTIQPEDEFGI